MKTEKMNIFIEFCMFPHNFDFWDQICPKMAFLVENRKSEHHHGILHIQISQGTKFLLKLKILTFSTKFAQNKDFQPKSEKANITIEFYISELT